MGLGTNGADTTIKIIENENRVLLQQEVNELVEDWYEVSNVNVNTGTKNGKTIYIATVVGMINRPDRYYY